MADDLAGIYREYERYVSDLRRVLEAATEETADELLARMQTLTNLDDHTLADLRRLDHPYAQRHGLGSGPHPDYEVHNQSGELHDTLRTEHEGRWLNGRLASEIHDDAGHLWHVLQGTEKMRPRDFASAAILQEIGDSETRYRAAFASVGDEYRDDGRSVIEVELIDHSEHEVQLPEGS